MSVQQSLAIIALIVWLAFTIYFYKESALPNVVLRLIAALVWAILTTLVVAALCVVVYIMVAMALGHL